MLVGGEFLSRSGNNRTRYCYYLSIVISHFHKRRFCGTGEYHLPKISNIFTSFQGHTMHSAEWNSEVALENKTVAVVGSGASAIQIIPSIVGKVGKLLSYQRTPAWVIGRCQFSISRCTQWVFANIPGVRRLYRTSIYLANEIQYPAFQIQGLLSHIGRLSSCEFNINVIIPYISFINNLERKSCC